MEIKKCRKCKQELELENFNPDRLWKFGVWSTCKTCNDTLCQNKVKTSLIAKKPIKKIGFKKLKRLRNEWSEVKVFEEVNLLDKNCWSCWKYIQEPSSITFPHLLEKSKFPAFRLFTNNVARACSIEHHQEIDKKMLVIKRDLEKLNEFKKLLLDWKREDIKQFII